MLNILKNFRIINYIYFDLIYKNILYLHLCMIILNRNKYLIVEH
ncbi:hypothetical protein HMPREF9970_1533 [Lachnoanaerobaculum saburreum F0468]|uniref:Uncharacterized protein n=1 Tax=Lachnoanaerobaculum saburreum F0468 TaxID=1095750 RepID=I0R8Y5_9FIRM|nr:hypothetical protein HMPREF9970_1533 [Lachnoanaerobaculum saburreum F0468]